MTQRGPNGRVQALSFLTDQDQLLTIPQGAVRAALGGLPSSLFIIERQGQDYLISGAGFGHGVGLSQFGARALAAEGWSAGEILDFYFPAYQLSGGEPAAGLNSAQ